MKTYNFGLAALPVEADAKMAMFACLRRRDILLIAMAKSVTLSVNYCFLQFWRRRSVTCTAAKLVQRQVSLKVPLFGCLQSLVARPGWHVQDKLEYLRCVREHPCNSGNPISLLLTILSQILPIQ